MKKEIIVQNLVRLQKNPGKGLVSKFTFEDKTDEGEGWIRIHIAGGGKLNIWVQDNKGSVIADPWSSEIKWPCTKNNIWGAIEICGGIWAE